jgi:hypothetical protein
MRNSNKITKYLQFAEQIQEIWHQDQVQTVPITIPAIVKNFSINPLIYCHAYHLHFLSE